MRKESIWFLNVSFNYFVTKKKRFNSFNFLKGNINLGPVNKAI